MTDKNVQDVELDDNDVVEAHDPKNAEQQSVDSVKAAEKAGPTAKARKGDKSNSEPMPKSKAGMISAAHDLMSEMTADEVADVLEALMGEEIDLEEDLDEAALSPEKKKAMKLGAQLSYSGVRADRSGSRLQAKHVANVQSGRAKAASDLMKKSSGVATAFNKGSKAGENARGERDAHMAANWKPKKKGGYVSGPTKKLPEDYEIDYTDLNALVESEATLSEEFKAKTAVIFEAAVKARLSEEIDRLEEAYATELQEEVAAHKAELVEKVDSYLNYVVETWVQENKLAIQAGLRTEIAETFMSKLKDLFTESYIEVPESKVDLVDELTQANDELEEQLNSAVAKSIKIAEELETYKRDAIIREASRDLADTQVAKLASLVENIDFTDEETFASKVKTIKESYFKKKTAESIIVEDTEADNSEEVSGTMAQYLKAIRKSSN